MNYILSNDIDFFKEINNYDDIDNEQNQDNNQNLCLITQEPLKDNFIKLSCNHNFNYIPIYNEILHQKKIINKRLETSKISLYQIKCPFCRTIHNGVLPYYETNNIQLINGINSPYKYILPCYTCNYDKKNNTKCNKKANCYNKGHYCTTHYNYLINKEKHKDNIEIKYCKAILKTGKNKGSECKCIIKDKDSIYCKRHTKT
tara:strand:- start:1807 stop:2412 length:606 start_codon:yes stop_codon:yes gene_type:complete